MQASIPKGVGWGGGGGLHMEPYSLHAWRQSLPREGDACKTDLQGQRQRFSVREGAYTEPLGLSCRRQHPSCKGECVWSRTAFTAGGSALPTREWRARLAFEANVSAFSVMGGTRAEPLGLSGQQQHQS